MPWILVVFVVSAINEPPPYVAFQTAFETHELCGAAAAKMDGLLDDAELPGFGKVKTFCIQVSN